MHVQKNTRLNAWMVWARGIIRYYLRKFYFRIIKASIPFVVFLVIVVGFVVDDVRSSNTACYYHNEVFLPKYENTLIRNFAHRGTWKFASHISGCCQ